MTQNSVYYRPCWTEIHRSSFLHNLTTLRQYLSPQTELLAVVKANAYGHGMAPIASWAESGGASWLGVSSLEEGIQLRDSGISKPILVLGSLYPYDVFPILFQKQLTPTVASLEAAEALHRLAESKNKPIPVHLKIDTGFGRIGVSPSHAVEFIRQVAQKKGLLLEGIYTQFTSSDCDPDYTAWQRNAFEKILQEIQAMDIRPRWIHMANSAALLRYPETHGTLVRPGLALYGIRPAPDLPASLALQPILTWKTRIIFLKQIVQGAIVSYGNTWKSKRLSRIATLAVGYADGLPRLLSNQGFVLIQGKRAPIIGRVTMDMTMVDVTDLPECHIGEEVVLVGRQLEDQIAIEEIAKLAQTNSYEILCDIGARVPRLYVE